MGLDVYLHRLADGSTFDEFYAKKEAYNKEYEAFYEREDYDKLTDAEKKELMPKDPEDGISEEIEQNSTHDPEHLFKIGYFRSSYNQGGVNSVLRRMGVGDLYHIFFEDEGRDAYIFRPNWGEALVRVSEVIARYDELKAAARGHIVRAIPIQSFHTFEDVRSEADAMEIFLKELAKNDEQIARWEEEGKPENHFLGNPNDAAYSSYHGEFYFGRSAWTVKALIGGMVEYIGQPQPGIYAVLEQEPLEKDWYRDALMIVRETILYVLDSGEPESFYFHWSA